ncbi:MAG: hypothetical protein K8F60_10565 [Melioribacteraceae bacterium]|jgi:hypothetical protein|nr:hypothetical protein [Ignavibacteriota bacterium]MBZ0182889.1 hypothetical protein [Melioribacteraceae bacterium]|tara:strand:+ start:133 stop:345 length:213 start_codon:yes stop_codon:yes gene_type:complete
MPNYYVNKNAQSTGEHEVHEESCSKLPHYENRIHLGYFFKCEDAVKKAKEIIKNAEVDGCKICSSACHKK